MTDTGERHGWPVVRGIVALKWNLLRNGLRGSTQLRLQTVLSVVFSTVGGVVAFALLAGLGRSFSSSASAVVVVLPVVVLATGLLAAAAGVESTVDVRMVASLPVSPSSMSTGVLVGALVGPPAILGAASGLGWGSPSGSAAVGRRRGPSWRSPWSSGGRPSSSSAGRRPTASARSPRGGGG